MSRSQKVFVAICAVFIILLLMVVAGNVAQMNKGEDRLEELYQNCIDENDDIMSYADAVEICDQALEDANTFG